MRALLSSAVVLTSCLVGCRGWESDQPPVHLIPNMDTQEKGRPYRRDNTGLFADGRMMRAPVPGTVAQGQLMDDDLFELGLEADGGIAAKFPASVTVDDALRARGKARFQIYCSPCHGAKADGKGLVPARDAGMLVPPPSFHDQRLKDMPAGQIYRAMKVGVNNGNMPSYASQIPPEDRWAIVAGIRGYQKELDAKVTDEGTGGVVVPKATVASVEHGAILYKARGCNACHSLDGSRIVGPSWKGVFGRTEQTSAGDVVVDDAYIKESILTPLAKVVNGFPPAMPPAQLDDIEIQSIVLFIKEQK